MIKTLITFPYELARLPLVIVDNRLSEKLSQTSRARSNFRPWTRRRK